METQKYLYSLEFLFENWSFNNFISQDSFLTNIEILMKELNFFTNNINDEQRDSEIKIFNSFDIDNDSSLSFSEFTLYYKNYLLDIIKINYVVGIDVGGTNTDVVIVEMPRIKILSSIKTTTTVDIKTGVLSALEKVFDLQKIIKKEDIKAVMIGTTAFVNAIIQCSNDISKVTVIRLCGHSTRALPPYNKFLIWK